MTGRSRVNTKWPLPGAAIVALFCLVPQLAAALDHNGTCAGSFDPAQNPHRLIGACGVPAGQTLTILPGVILVGQNNTLTVQAGGTLVAVGTSAAQRDVQLQNVHISFSGPSGATPASGGQLANCTITGPSAGTSLGITDASPTVTNCTVSGVSTAISVGGSSLVSPAQPTISGNAITASSYCIQVSGTAQPTLTGNAITTNSVGLDYSGTAAGAVTGNTIGFTPQGASGRRAIQVGGGAAPLIDSNTINDDATESDIGIAVSVNPGVGVRVTNNTVHASGGDRLFSLDPDVFAAGPVISGNLFPDGIAGGIGVSGTLSSSATLGTLQGQSTYLMTGGLTVANGATLTIAPGVTLVGQNNTLTVQAGGTLVAVGTSEAQRDVQFQNVYVSFQGPNGATPASGGQLKNCALTGPSQHYSYSVVAITDASPTVTSCTISTTNGYGIGISGSSQVTPAQPTISGNTISASNRGIDVSGTAQPTLTSNAISTNGWGIAYRDSAGGTASGNTISFQAQAGNGRIGIDVAGNAAPTLDGNTINDDTTESDVGIRLEGNLGAAVQVTNNTIHASGGDRLLDLVPNALGAGPVISGNLFPDGIAGGIGVSGTLSGSATLGTVQGRSTYLMTGGLTVANGATLTIAPGVTLVGQNNTLTVQAGGTLVAVGTSAAQRDVQFQNVYISFNGPSGSTPASGGQLGKCTLTGPSGGTSLGITDASPTITNCTISGVYTAISVGGSSQVTPAQPTISGNTISASNRGIDVSGTAQPTLTSNSISTNGWGIAYRDSAGGTASGNTISFQAQAGNGRIGIDVAGDAAPTLDGNTINDDTTESDVGIRLEGNFGAAVQATNNTIHASGGDRVMDLGANVFVPGPTISGNQFPDGMGSGLGLSGTLTSSGTLGAVQGQASYLLLGNVVVAAGATLTIAPGVTLDGGTPCGWCGASGVEVQSGGQLSAVGTSSGQRDVHFHNAWVQFDAGSGGTLANCTLSGPGTYYSGTAVGISDASPSVHDCTITDSSTGIGVSGSVQLTPAAPEISGNTIAVSGRGIDVSGTAQPTVSGNSITTNGAGLVYRDSAGGTASGNTISFQAQAGNGRIGIDVAGNAAPILDSNTINDDTTESDVGIRLEGNLGAAVQVTNNTIHASGGDRLLDLVPNAFGAGPVISGNLFPDGIAGGIGVSGTLSGSATLGAVQGQSTYLMTGGLTVANGATLTIAPGVTLVGQNNTLTVQAGGTLVAVGTSAAQRDVQFQNVYISFNGPSGSTPASGGQLKNCTLTGPSQYYPYSVVAIADASPTVMSCTISTTNGYGIGISGSSQVTPAQPTISGNTISASNRGIDVSGTASVHIVSNSLMGSPTAVYLHDTTTPSTVQDNTFAGNTFSLSFGQASTVFGAFPLMFDTNAFVGSSEQNLIQLPSSMTVTAGGTVSAAKVPYLVAGITVNAGATLVLQPGVVFKNTSYSSINVNGDLVASGTTDRPIVFSSQTPKSGTRWRGLRLNNQAPNSASRLDACIVEFGGASGEPALRFNQSSINVNDVNVLASAGPGVQVASNSSPHVTGGAVTMSTSDGVQVVSGSHPVFAQVSVLRNGGVGMVNQDCATVRTPIAAQGVYWGDDSGPLDSSDDRAKGGLYNPNGRGDEVSDCVNYDPWVRLGPSIEGTLTAVSGGGQSGPPGSALPTPLCVEVQSTLNSPLQGIEVTFSTTEGGGTIETQQPVQTDANGQACAQLRLGLAAGPNGVAATARDVDSPLATFTAQGTSGSATDLFTLTTLPSPAVGAGTGDVNGDGYVTIADAALIEAVLHGIIAADEPPAVEFTAHADANGDGIADVGDELVILRHAVAQPGGRTRGSATRVGFQAYIRAPRTAPAVGETFRVPVFVKDLGAGIAAYALQVRYDPSALEIVAIDGGTFPGFRQRPVTDPTTFKRGRTRFAAVDHGLLTTHGTTNVADIVFRVVGNSCAQTPLTLDAAERYPFVAKRGFAAVPLRKRYSATVTTQRDNAIRAGLR